MYYFYVFTAKSIITGDKTANMKELFNGQKCSKTHIRGYTVSKIFPVQKPPDPHSKGAASNAEGGERLKKGRGGEGDG